MSERASGRPGILESTAIVLAIAVACLAMVPADAGLRAATLAPVGRDAAPAKPTADADATDMLLHD